MVQHFDMSGLAAWTLQVCSFGQTSTIFWALLLISIQLSFLPQAASPADPAR